MRHRIEDRVAFLLAGKRRARYIRVIGISEHAPVEMFAQVGYTIIIHYLLSAATPNHEERAGLLLLTNKPEHIRLDVPIYSRPSGIATRFTLEAFHPLFSSPCGRWPVQLGVVAEVVFDIRA